MSLNELAEEVYVDALAHGWWDNTASRNYGEMIALMHSELSEALEELRAGNDPTYIYHRTDGKPEGFLVELADCVIRIFDLVGSLDIDFDSVVKEKIDFNKTRPYKHNKEF